MPAPHFGHGIGIEHEPVIHDRMLAEAAVVGDQLARPVLQPVAAGLVPPAAVRVALRRQPAPADEQRGSLRGAVVIVLGDGVAQGRRDALQVRADQRHQRGRRREVLPQHQRGHRQVHDADRRFLPALPVGTEIRRIGPRPGRQPRIELSHGLGPAAHRLLRQDQDPVEARRLPNRLDVAHGGVEIGDLPPWLRGLVDPRAVERIAVPVRLRVLRGLVPAEIAHRDGLFHGMADQPLGRGLDPALGEEGAGGDLGPQPAHRIEAELHADAIAQGPRQARQAERERGACQDKRGRFIVHAAAWLPGR